MKYIHKQYLIHFLIFGFINALLQTLLNLDRASIGSFLFYFIFTGGLMSLFMVKMQQRSLAKQGIIDLDEEAYDAYQKRELTTQLSREEFDAFICNAKTYDIKSKNGNKYLIKKKYYTTEFERAVSLTYVEGEPSRIVIENFPNKFTVSDIGIAHKTVNEMNDYLVRALANPEIA